MYISDKGNNCIRKVTVSTGIITTVAGTGASSYSGDGGQATSAGIYSPHAIALDSAGISRITTYLVNISLFTFLIFFSFLGNVYIADSSNHRIRKVTVSSTTSTPRYRICLSSFL